MSSRFKIWVAVVLGLGFLLLVVARWGYDKLQIINDLDAIEAEIVKEFPDVDHLSTASFATIRQTDPDLLLIDCRKPEEYAVSRIPGAVNLGTASEVAEFLKGSTEPPGRIVVYCAVGWRSAKLARALEKEGVENVANLKGAIFRWANEDRPIEKPDGSPASTVHPLHELWAGLLKEGKAEPVD